MFIEVRSDPLLEEIMMSSCPSAPSTALIATTPTGNGGPSGGVAGGISGASGNRSTGVPQGAPFGGTGGGGSSSSHHRRHGNGYSNHKTSGGGAGGHTGAAPLVGRPPSTTPGPAPSRCGPGNSIHARALSSSIRAPTQPRPGGVPLPHALAAGYTLPSYPLPWPPRVDPGPAPPGLGPWDQQSLANSFNTMTLTSPPTTD